MFEAVLILLGVAFVFEAIAPWLLQKYFPQALLAPAPEVPVRPRRTADRNDAHVDNAMEQQLANVQKVNVQAPQAPRGSDSLVSTSGAAQALASVDPDASFDYDEFRPAAREDLKAVQVAQGVPDVFEEDAASAHA